MFEASGNQGAKRKEWRTAWLEFIADGSLIRCLNEKNETVDHLTLYF